MHSADASLDLSALDAGRAPTEREAQIWATRSGLRLLILGVLLQWIPLVEYLGWILGAWGVLQMIRGRRPFGLRHERFVWVSVTLFLGATVSAIALDQEFVLAVDRAVDTWIDTVDVGSVVATYEGLALGSAILSAWVAACYVILAHDLEDTAGRRWLFTALAVQVAASVVVFLGILDPYIRTAVPSAYLGTRFDGAALQAVTAEVTGPSPLRLADALPAAILAYAYLRAARRIDRAEIPPPEASTDPRPAESP